MLYFANPSTGPVREVMTAGRLGAIMTPAQGNSLPPDAPWCADNGRFGNGYPGHDAWFAWLQSRTLEQRQRCQFVALPDVVGDAQATLADSLPWVWKVHALGYPVALVAQDGLEHLDVPWDAFEVLFIGGTTDWKLSKHARWLVEDAREYGKRVHMGRVNSKQRLLYAHGIGCHSADGTYIKFGPDINLPKMLAWLEGMA